MLFVRSVKSIYCVTIVMVGNPSTILPELPVKSPASQLMHSSPQRRPKPQGSRASGLPYVLATKMTTLTEKFRIKEASSGTRTKALSCPGLPPLTELAVVGIMKAAPGQNVFFMGFISPRSIVLMNGLHSGMNGIKIVLLTVLPVSELLFVREEFSTSSLNHTTNEYLFLFVPL